MAKSKKLISIGLLVILVMTSLIGCGGKKAANEGAGEEAESGESSDAVAAEGAKEITFWMFQENAELEFFQKCVDQYNSEQSNVVVKMEQIPWEDYNGTKMATAFAAGTGPDVFLVAPGLFLKYANSNILMPLNDHIQPDVLTDFSESSIDGVSIGEDILAIPFEMELLGLYYDKKVFSEAGIEPPKSWDEMYEAAKALTTSTRAGLTMETVKGTHQLFEWYPFLWQTGNNVFNADKSKADLNQENIIKNFELKRKMFEEGVANIKPSRNNTEGAIIAEGETAMQINGSWAIGSIEKQYPEAIDNIGVVPLPTPEGGEAATVAGGWKVCANANSPYAEEAAKFATWLFAADSSRMEEWCTKVKFAYAPRQSIIDANQEVYSQGLRNVFTEQILGSEQAEMRLPAEISNILQDLLQSVYFDTSTDINGEIQKADEKINEFLGSYDGDL